MSDNSYQYAKWGSEKKTGNRLGISQQSSCDVFRRTDFWPGFGLVFTVHIATKGQENSERIYKVIVFEHYEEVVYDRNHYFGFGPIPKPNLVDSFGRYRNRYRNNISKGKSSYQ